MSIFTASIASGSNGNCYYIGNREEAVLVDVGISCKQIENRMSRLGLSMQGIKAIFISHEHTDHIRGLATLVKKYQIPVYMTPGTWNAIQHEVPENLMHYLSSDIKVYLENLEVTAFPKIHDAAEPVSFVVASHNTRIGVFTDIGRVCEQVSSHFSTCDVAFLEFNYEKDLLDNGRYPQFLKTRIKGGFGHLSNHEAMDLLLNKRNPELKLIIASHLSGDNNSPHTVHNLFQQVSSAFMDDFCFHVATRDRESSLFEINKSSEVKNQLVEFNQLLFS